MKRPNQLNQFKPNLIKRIIATVLDYGIFLLGTFIYAYIFGEINEAGEIEVNNLMALPVFLAWLIYFVFMEAFTGATFGHHSMKLMVLTTNRRSISFDHAIKRRLLDVIDICIYGIPAIIAIKNSDKHQRLGDMWAKTIVVDTTDKDQYYQMKG